MELEKIVVKLPPDNTQEPTACQIVDKKYWSGHSKQVFQLKSSKEMKKKWQEVLVNNNIPTAEKSVQPVHFKLL